MTETKKEEVKLTKEELQNIINVIAAYKGYSIAEANYMNNVIIKLKLMSDLI